MIVQETDSREPIEPQERLASFIAHNGGRINFEQFMQESLYGKGAYYQSKVKIGSTESGADFGTFSLHELFGYLIFCYQQNLMASHPDYKFVELAGGTGKHKETILEYAKKAGVDFPYISVDISQKFIKLQSDEGGENIQASALSLPFADKSIKGTIFANELIDALPMRVVRVNNPETIYPRSSGTISFEELVYTVSEQGVVSHEWVLASQEVQDYWEDQCEYFRERGFIPEAHLSDGEILSFNLHEAELVTELNRVLAEGEIVLIDYGHHLDKLLDEKGAGTVPMQYPSERDTDPEDIHHNAYMTDITANVNFSSLIRAAKKLNLEVEFVPQHIFFARQFSDKDIVRYTSDEKFAAMVDDTTYDNPLSNTKEFNVLILKKKSAKKQTQLV